MIAWIKQQLTGSPSPNPAQLLQKAAKVTLPQVKAMPKANTPEATVEEAKENKRVAKLIMVTVNNNNKFYEMCENSDGTFTATYGRVGSSGTSRSYPMNQWDTKYNEKVRKGYKDQTHLFAAGKTEIDTLEIEDKAVESFINQLMQDARQSIKYNYNVSAAEVTRKQVQEAQALLDDLVSRVKLRMKAKYFNDKLLELFQVIPRRMTKVNDHLVKTPKNDEEIKAINEMLAQEQATLDVMRGQVELNEQEEEQPTQTERMDLLQAMGIQMEQVTDKALVKMIKKMMNGDGKKFKRAYKVINVRTQKAFDAHLAKAADKKTELFWHGSRNENWMSIMKSGLVLRPANAVINGKMFGYGLYFADKFQKSLNYSSLRGSFWSNGNQNRGYLALYDVHVGKQLKIKKHQTWCGTLNEDNLKKQGAKYDSVFAKGGADLINNEYIVYNQSQSTIRYIIEVG